MELPLPSGFDKLLMLVPGHAGALFGLSECGCDQRETWRERGRHLRNYSAPPTTDASRWISMGCIFVSATS